MGRRGRPTHAGIPRKHHSRSDPAVGALFLLGLTPPTAVGDRARSASAECLLRDAATGRP